MTVATGHGAEPDVHFCQTLARQCEEHGRLLKPVVERYGEDASDAEPERLHADGLSSTREGPVGLLRDLQDVYLQASFVDVTWTVVNRPPPLFATGSSWTWSCTARARPRSSSGGSRPG